MNTSHHEGHEGQIGGELPRPVFLRVPRDESKDAGRLSRSPKYILGGRADGAGVWLRAVAFCTGRFFAVGENTVSPAGGQVWTSTDGRAWTRVEVPDLPPLGGIAAGPGGWVAAGDDGRVLTSSDGVSG